MRVLTDAHTQTAPLVVYIVVARPKMPIRFACMDESLYKVIVFSCQKCNHTTSELEYYICVVGQLLDWLHVDNESTYTTSVFITSTTDVGGKK